MSEEQKPESSKPTSKFIEKNKNWLIVGAVIVVLGGIFFWQQYQNRQNVKRLKAELERLQQNGSAESVKELLDRVKKIIVLPENEQPTVATVTNLEKLKDQPFFQNAQIGDKVLIFQQSKKAVLYRPSEDKVVEIAPLSSNDQQAAAAQPVSVEIRNASGKSGAANAVKTQLDGNSSFSVAALGSSSEVLDQTTIVDLTHGQKPQELSVLQKMLNAKILDALPKEESSSNAQFVVLVGKQ